MKSTKTEIRSIAATAIVLLLLVGGGAFAYATRTPMNNHSNGPIPLDDSDSTATSTSSSGSEEHSSSTHTDSEHHSETHTSSASHTETSESETERVTESHATTSSNDNNQGENNNNQEEHELQFRIVSAGSQFPGQGETNIDIHGLVLDVHVEIEKANATTEYRVVLSVNGSSSVLGTLVTNSEGDGEMQAQFKAEKAGTYEIGIVLLAGNIPALKSDPSTHAGVLAQRNESETETEQAETRSVHTLKGDQHDEDEIRQEKDNKTIPAVVSVGSSGASVLTLDPRFSVSVGKLENDGIAVSISAVNVTGPKVLLINLTGSSLANLSDKTLAVTFDGKEVVEASSLAQVLSPLPTDPARFIILVTSSGVQLLVSIPHFSLHVIQVLPMALTNTPSPQNLLATNEILLIGSAIAIIAVSAAVIAKTRRVHS